MILFRLAYAGAGFLVAQWYDLGFHPAGVACAVALVGIAESYRALLPLFEKH